MKKIFYFLALIPWSVLVAQPSMSWKKTYGGSENEQFGVSLPTDDGGFIMVANTRSADGDILVSLGLADIWLVKSNQNGAIEWQKTFGGSGGDAVSRLIPTKDGGYLIVGYSSSNDGDVTNAHGDADFWLIKINNLGGMEWQKTFGGSGLETSAQVYQTDDEGYIIAGTTYSSDGDVINAHGDADIWVAKMSATAEVVWSRTLGGTKIDKLYSLAPGLDGGCIISGHTASSDGDFSTNYGSLDAFAVHIDTTGAIAWTKVLGGSAEESGDQVISGFDGGYLFAGRTSSVGGSFENYNGGQDVFVSKLNGSGDVEWSKLYGGTEVETGKVLLTQDGGFVIVGTTGSTFGGFLGNGAFDVWVIKLDGEGNIQWQKVLGGSNIEYGYEITEQSDGTFLVLGVTSSNNGNVSFLHGAFDLWMLKLGASGDLIWEKTFGGSDQDGPDNNNWFQTTDGGYIIQSSTTSVDGDINGAHGKKDLWAFKIPAQTTVSTIFPDQHLDEIIHLAPNPAKQSAVLTVSDPGVQISTYQITITDAFGRIMEKRTVRDQTTLITLENYLAGVYVVIVQKDNGLLLKTKLVVLHD